ncbi:hypothetical protein VNO77_35476 [Canavalia gladiata]|uniref:CASP-like protein n=1 Tax=Canavalia gladiata TaxID=3824 RepID=A0AAN9Q0F2_CANGL
MTSTGTKSESKNNERRKNRYYSNSKEKEEVEDLECSKKNKEDQNSVSESFSSHKSASAPTLADELMSDGDLQMVVTNSHSFSSVRDVVKDIEEIELEGTNGEFNSKEERKWWKLLLALRIAGFVLCKIAFSLLASDNQKLLLRVPSYWQGDYIELPYQLHWYYYREFRYCLTINVIGFVYCGVQICDLIKYLITKRHTVDPKLRGYFNIAMDQALAYLLMSASSSAATRAHDFRNSDGLAFKFMEMANASVAFSLVAFVAFVSSSIVSTFILCRFN